MKVLIYDLEQDAHDRVSLIVRLKWPDSQLFVAEESDLALEMIEKEQPDFCVTATPKGANQDNSPGDWVKRLRHFSNVPLFVLTYDTSETQAASLFEAGADDVIRLPSDNLEILARFISLLRRVHLADVSNDERNIAIGSLLMNANTYEVYLNDKPLNLTPTEFRLLHALLKSKNTVVTHHFLERLLWDDKYDSKSLVKKYVQRLRQKLGDNPSSSEWIVSVHGVGYRFVVPQNTDGNSPSGARIASFIGALIAVATPALLLLSTLGDSLNVAA